MLDRTKTPAIHALESIGFQKPERIKMPNGIELVTLNAGSEEVVRIDIVFRSGILKQEHFLQCLFTNAMLRNSTRSYTQDTINEQLDYYGAWLKLGVHHEYSFITLYSLNKYVEQTLHLVQSMLFEPLFLENELAVIRSERKQQAKIFREKVNVMAYKAMNSGLYGAQHPLAAQAELEDYDLVTSDLLHTYHRQHYHSANCCVYVSGKVTEEVCRQVEAQLGTTPFGTPIPWQPAVVPPAQPSGQKRIYAEKAAAMQNAVNLATLSIGEKHPDALKLSVAITVLGGYFGSRLMSNIREDKGYTYGISAYQIPQMGHSVFMISTQTASEYVEPLIAEVYHEIDKLQAQPVDTSELTMVKNYMLGNICRSYENAFSLSEAWITNDMSGLPEDYFDATVQAIRNVSAAEIQLLAQKYFCKQNLIEVVAGKITHPLTDSVG